MEIKKLTRRNFFKVSALFAGTVVTVSNKPGLLSTALAANPDDTITKQNYISDVSTGEFKDEKKDKKKFEKHEKKITKELKKAAKEEKSTVEEFFPKASEIKPMCLYCTHYKKPEGGYGECAMVGAKGDVKVSEKGWCKVWAINKSKVTEAAKG